MGWFSNPGDNDDKKNASEKSKLFSQTSSTSVSRSCRPDPQDYNYMICKTVTQKKTYKDGKPVNTSEEKEERIPADQYANHVHQSMAKSANLDDLFKRNQDYKSMDGMDGTLEGHLFNMFERLSGLFPEFGRQAEKQPRKETTEEQPSQREVPSQKNEKKPSHSSKIYQQTYQNSPYGFPGQVPYDYSFLKKKKRTEDDIFDV